jgi:hypothetical protein
MPGVNVEAITRDCLREQMASGKAQASLPASRRRNGPVSSKVEPVVWWSLQKEVSRRGKPRFDEFARQALRDGCGQDAETGKPAV